MCKLLFINEHQVLLRAYDSKCSFQQSRSVGYKQCGGLHGEFKDNGGDVGNFCMISITSPNNHLLKVASSLVTL